jgi:hypothetical protein
MYASVLIVFALLASICHGIPPDDSIPMELFLPNSGVPTWHKEIDPKDVGVQSSAPPYTVLLDTARRMFNWVKVQDYGRSTTETAMVAVMYDPITQRI